MITTLPPCFAEVCDNFLHYCVAGVEAVLDGDHVIEYRVRNVTVTSSADETDVQYG